MLIALGSIRLKFVKFVKFVKFFFESFREIRKFSRIIEVQRAPKRLPSRVADSTLHSPLSSPLQGGRGGLFVYRERLHSVAFFFEADVYPAGRDVAVLVVAGLVDKLVEDEVVLNQVVEGVDVLAWHHYVRRLAFAVLAVAGAADAEVEQGAAVAAADA